MKVLMLLDLLDRLGWTQLKVYWKCLCKTRRKEIYTVCLAFYSISFTQQ